MVSFSVTFNNVLQTLLYILPGFLLCFFRKGKAEHLSTMSSLLLYACAPCMFAANIMALDGSLRVFIQMGIFALITMAGMLLFMLLLRLIFRKKQADFRFRMMNCAAVMGNVGFFGLPIVKAVFPQFPEAAAYSCIYCATMNILAWTFGAYSITGEKKHVSLRVAFLNPTVISVALALVLCAINAKAWLPPLITDGVNTIGLLTTPLSLIILGMRLTTMKPREIFGQPLIYGISLCKMLAFPLFTYAVSMLFPISPVGRACALLLSGTPCASILLNLSQIHHHGQDMAADCALLSTLISFLTIPLLTLIL